MALPPTAKTAPTPPLARGFIAELEGLRCLAISAVMLHRFWPRSGPLAASFGKVAELGWMGVDLFFVISGTLIAGILLDARGTPNFYRNFYARRALRIFPLYYLFVGATLVVFPLLEGGPYFGTEFVRSVGSPLYYLFYAGNVPEMIGHMPSYFLSPVWSLAIEEQFYLTFPLAVAYLSRRHLTWLLGAAVVFAPIFRVATVALWPGNERIQYLATPSRFDEIALGCLLAIGLRALPGRVTMRSTSAFLGAAALAFGLALGLGGLDRMSLFGRVAGYSIVAFTCAALVLWTVAHRDRGGFAQALRFGPVMYVGKLCYGLYLLHRPASFAIDQLLDRWPVVAPDGLSAVALKYAAALGLAAVSWALLEKPFLALKSRFASGPTAECAPAPPSAAAPASGAVR